MAAPKNINIKNRILETTISLLQNKSFDDISLAGIAKEANISKGTLYYYYNNKEDILFDITEAYLSSLAEELIVWVMNKEKDTSLPRLIHFVLEKGTFKRFGNLRIYLAGAAVSGNNALREKYVEKYLFFKATLTATILERAPQADAEYISWLILTAMDGMLIQQQLGTPSFNRASYIQKTVAVILGQIQDEPSPLCSE